MNTLAELSDAHREAARVFGDALGRHEGPTQAERDAYLEANDAFAEALTAAGLGRVTK